MGMTVYQVCTEHLNMQIFEENYFENVIISLRL
jgi:hypothetical protein